MRLTLKAAAIATALLLTSFLAPMAIAADADDQPLNTITNGRYGLFNWLDHRSAYTQEVFPEPFLIDDIALEDNELELDWSHLKGRGKQTDIGSVEYQKGFGLLTVEAEMSYQGIVSTAHGTIEGLGPLELGARYPLAQYVSAHRMFDITVGPGLESEIPLQLRVSRNASLEPLGFAALRLAQRFTAEVSAGYEVLFGSGGDGGERSYEFGLSCAYAIPLQQWHLPAVEQVLPMIELSNELGLNKDEEGKNDFEGDAGFRVQLKRMGEMQANLGCVFVLPLDTVARDELHWGVIASLILDF